MKQKCKVCGLNAESDYCFRHKPRKSLPTGRSKILRNLEKAGIDLMKNFFMEIWRTRPHRSEVSNTFLGNEPLTVFFHHILPKEEKKYPQAMYDKENIILLTLQEHESVELDMYKYIVINERREKLLKKYGN